MQEVIAWHERGGWWTCEVRGLRGFYDIDTAEHEGLGWEVCTGKRPEKSAILAEGPETGEAGRLLAEAYIRGHVAPEVA